MTKRFKKDGNVILVADDALLSDWEGYEEDVVDMSTPLLFEANTRPQRREIRERRDNLLSETDWCANSDVIMSDDMTTYRQALRDITSQDGFPINITWPTKP